MHAHTHTHTHTPQGAGPPWARVEQPQRRGIRVGGLCSPCPLAPLPGDPRVSARVCRHGHRGPPPPRRWSPSASCPADAAATTASIWISTARPFLPAPCPCAPRTARPRQLGAQGAERSSVAWHGARRRRRHHTRSTPRAAALISRTRAPPPAPPAPAPPARSPSLAKACESAMALILYSTSVLRAISQIHLCPRTLYRWSSRGPAKSKK